jgi:hypothetical protein
MIIFGGKISHSFVTSSDRKRRNKVLDIINIFLTSKGLPRCTSKAEVNAWAGQWARQSLHYESIL